MTHRTRGEGSSLQEGVRAGRELAGRQIVPRADTPARRLRTLSTGVLPLLLLGSAGLRAEVTYTGSFKCFEVWGETNSCAQHASSSATLPLGWGNFNASLQLLYPDQLPPGTVDSLWRVLTLPSPVQVTATVRLTYPAPSTPSPGTLYVFGVFSAMTATGSVDLCTGSSPVTPVFKSFPLNASGTTPVEATFTSCAFTAPRLYPDQTLQIYFQTGASTEQTASTGNIRAFVTGTYNLTSNGPPLDIDPAVSPATVDSATPIKAKVTGSGFVSGSTVQIGSGDVKVLATRYVSATQLDVDLGGYSRLEEGPRDVVVTNPDKTKQTGKDLFYVSSLMLASLEINQGVRMFCDWAEPCVADHRTVVRARVSCDVPGSTCPRSSAAGRLHVFQAGTAIPIVGSPFEADAPSVEVLSSTRIPSADARGRGRDALNFHFKGDSSLLAGSYDFAFEVDPRNPGSAPSGPGPVPRSRLLSRSTNLRFVTSNPETIYVAVESSGDAARDGKELVLVLKEIPKLAGLRPSSLGMLNVAPLPFAFFSPPGRPEWLPELAMVSARLQELGASRSAEAPVHLLYVGKSLNRIGYFSGCSLVSSLGYPPVCPFPFGAIGTMWVEGGEIAHLLGHHDGLGDTAESNIWEPLLVRSVSNPYDGCPPEGCECQEGSYNTFTGNVSTPESPFPDYMGALQWNSWTGGQSWKALYNRLMPASPLPGSARVEAVQELLVVSGKVESSGAGSFGSFLRTQGTAPTLGTTGDYAVELQGASGTVLSSTKFAIDLSTLPTLTSLFGADSIPFTATLPWSSSASRVVLKHNGVEVASRKVSTNAPVVALSYPVGGESLSGTATVRWSGSDADGDPLTYTVLYSANGTTWIPLATGLTATTFAWDTTQVRGTATGKIKVVASDGVNEGSATSPGTFSVPRKGPVAAIAQPADGTVVLPGAAVAFDGAAFDPEDGLLSGSALSFSSSRDGVLGTGTSVTTSSLSTGLHTITLTATDKDGNKATASITLNVFSRPSTPSATAFAPIVLTTAGLNGSFFTSELTLTNRGSTAATVEFDYTSAFGGGSGVGYDSLPAGRQKILPDAIAYLTQLGLPIPLDGNRGGTLRLRFYGLSSPTAGAATVRTTTAVPQGRAGLSYPAIPPALLTGTVYLCGLRQTATDRSNLALLNVGSETDGDVGLRVTVYSGDPAAPQSKILPDIFLSPGGFNQISQVLAAEGLSISNGYVKVERVSGTAPYYAYAVINDQANSDGSFVPPVLVSALVGKSGITLPVAVEAGSFTTELVVTNFGTASRTFQLQYVASAIQATGNTASLTVTLAPGEQRIFPSFVQNLRDQRVSGIGEAGTTYAGAVFLTVSSGDVSGLFVGGRTSAPGGGGRYGLFYTGVPYGAASTGAAWLYGLQQSEQNRTNLAIVNTGETDSSPSSFRIDLYDGTTGGLVNAVGGITVGARGFTQLSSILAQYAPSSPHAYAHVVRTAGSNPFLCYAVVNDGGTPGVRSDDGAFVAMDLSDQPAAPALDISPTSLAFGSVTTGQTKEMTVTVRNAGAGTLTGSASTSTPFSVVSGGSLSLAANQSQTVTLRFTPTAASTSNGSLVVTTNAGNGQVSLSGTGTAPTTAQVELSTDDGRVELAVVQDGLSLVNRLTPARYPATLQKIRFYVPMITGYPNPSGGQVRLLAFVDPASGGKPPSPVAVLLDQAFTLPTIPSGGAWVEATIPSFPSLSSGDLYVGYRLPTPAGGVGFAADTTSPPQKRGFYSNDGGLSWKGPLVIDSGGQQLPANMMIRAVVAVPWP